MQEATTCTAPSQEVVGYLANRLHRAYGYDRTHVWDAERAAGLFANLTVETLRELDSFCVETHGIAEVETARTEDGRLLWRARGPVGSFYDTERWDESARLAARCVSSGNEWSGISRNSSGATPGPLVVGLS